MKKNLKRNKVLLTSLLGLAVVASATAAFSTWIFGVINKTANNDLTISVDTTQNKSVVLTANATNKTLNVGEKDDVENENYVNVKKFANGLDFTLDAFKITFSSETITPKQINFTLAESTDNKINVSSDYFGRSDAEYTYIALAQESIDLTTNPDNKIYKVLPGGDGNGNTVWDIKDKLIEFKWGTFFEYSYSNGEGAGTTTTSKPSQFYNKKIAEKTSDAEKLTAIKKAQDEVKTMYNKLDDKTIKLTITVDTEDVTASH